MYTMYANGVLFHNPGTTSTAYQAIGARATFELDKPEALTFTLPPDNVVYNSLQKRKTIVTLEENGTELFRGRVMEIIRDTFNMLEVYCEGELSLLKDSLQPPVEFEGSALEYLSMAIANHNAQMESDKQFSLGSVSALTDDYTVNVKTTEYRETLGDIRSLLMSEYGGHLIVRYSGGTRYLDYVKEYTGTSSGKVQFGVNLIEYENRKDSSKAFSMLVPLGAVVDKQRLTVASVTGSIYLTDSTALAKYGRIIKTKTFDGVEDPAELLRLGQEYMENALNVRTITVKAIDMGVLGGGIIRIGEQALISSSPHGINEYETCSKIELDIDNPEQSEFTFGRKPETLTGKMAQQQEKDDSMWHKLFDWLTVTDTELILAKQHISEQGDIISNVLFKMDALNANIQLKADQTVITELETRLSTAEILIDGANAAIDLKADRTTVTDLETRMTAAEILIDGANAEIALKAGTKEVDALGERLTTAELLIDGQNSKIEAKADLILLDGYVKTENLEAEVLSVLQYADLSQADLDVGYLDAGSAQISSLDSNSITTNSLSVGGVSFTSSSLSMGSVASGTIVGPADINLSHSHAVTVSGGTVTLGEVSSSGGSFNIADTQFYIDGVAAARKEGAEGVTLNFMGWQGGVATVEASNGATQKVNLPDFSVSGGDSFVSNKTTVYFSTASVSGPLASKEVDASSVYTNGFNSGYSSGYTAGQQSIDTGAYYDEGYSAGYRYGYDRGEASVTLTASGWSGSENVITASNGAKMTVKKHYSSKTTVSSGDTVFVSYNGAMVNATYRSGGSSFSYISNVTVS